MTADKKLDAGQKQRLAQLKRYRTEREQGYRERALKMYPWVCGRCAREFNHTNVRELTVHHIDHNHDNNPADGSNWELLCIYCHDEEHSKFEHMVHYGDHQETGSKPATHNPFSGLRDAMKSRSDS